ncbi:MAG: sigma-70 family RNA polymerase sigma factor [Candidatus Aminicenantes bacterium]|nr:sigma-70 family RNA polymerase sigma factor [Candidatus Aminicenantes bacterium]
MKTKNLAGESSVEQSLVIPKSEVLNMRKEESSEKDLLESVAKGDKGAYQKIVTRYKGTAYYVALGFVNNAQDALDISQEAFIKAFYKIRKFDTTRRFYPWFYKVLKNLCLDHLRKKKFTHEIPIERIAFFEDENKNRELKERIWRAIEQLSPVQREVIILRYFRQYSYKEIAELIQKPQGTVMSSLYYAKKKLKEILTPYLGDPNPVEMEK